MPKPRALTPAEEDQALAEYRAANGARGTIAKLARDRNLSWKGVREILKRAEERQAAALGDSRESPISLEDEVSRILLETA